MHIVIAFLTAVGGLAWALYRLQQSGVNLNDFNPFYWMRRRQWQKQVGTKPLHGLNSPMEAAAALLIGAAKLEGEISREQKQEIVAIFEHEFKLDAAAAKELFASSAYLLRETEDVTLEASYILKPVREKFTAETEASLIELLRRVAAIDHSISDRQAALIATVEAQLTPPNKQQSDWL